ncbi:MAG TPA: hypothetical protein DEP13_04615 [Gammaproteobacteria bacterium]|nr:MAG: hypothetical protein CBD74_01750 [Saprospirales bacterium TMED214]HCA35909.1 hypothetical protein [Gammaproteobacteria bacterium]
MTLLIDGRPWDYRDPFNADQLRRQNLGNERERVTVNEHSYEMTNPLYKYGEGFVIDAADALGIKNISEQEEVDRVLDYIRGGRSASEAKESSSPDSFKNYIADYDRKKFGAGSEKEPPTDRFSGLDIRKMFNAGVDDYDLSKVKSAKKVLNYAEDVEDMTKMGGKAEDTLDNLRKIIKKNSQSKNNNNKLPQRLKDARKEVKVTDLTKKDNRIPRVATRRGDDAALNAIRAGDDRVKWYGQKFVPHMEARANYGAESINNSLNYWLNQFAYGPPKLGDAYELFNKYSDAIENAS